MYAQLYTQYKRWLKRLAPGAALKSEGETMKIKLIIALLIAASGVTAAPQAVDKFNELRTAVENWTRQNLLNGILTASAHERQISENALFKASGAASPRVLNADEFRWNGRVAAGRTVDIKGVNGNIRAEPSSGSEVEVVASKRAKRSNPNEVQIKVIEHEGGVTICAVYPSGEPGRINECTIGNRWSSHTRNNDVEVDFTVRIPAGLNFAGRTVNGEVATGALNGDVEAYTVNGGIDISATGYAEAGTVNGSISVAMGNANWPRDLSFETVNGDITLNLPEATSVIVNAETLNGGIHSDFPVTVQGRLSRRRMTGTIGDGKHQLTLKTVNGSINMRRGQ
jgi:hypothetical protein